MAVRRFPGRWAIPQRAVWPEGVVMPAPGLDQDPSLGQGVEALAVTILPRTAGCDVERLEVYGVD